MNRRQPRATRTDTLLPYTTLVRSRRDAGKRVRARRTGKTHRRGRGVLLMIRMKNENAVHRARQDRIDLVFLSRNRKAHMQEIFRIAQIVRSEEHTSELQSLMRISYAVFCLKKKKAYYITNKTEHKHT